MTDKAELLLQLKRDCIACRLCSIGGCVYDDCPGNVFSNMSLKANIMVIGQNPGAFEVKSGKPFVGPAGANFDKGIAEVLGVGRDSFYITNACRCLTPNNRAPLPNELSNCRPFLDREMEIVKPSIVVALGNFSLFQMTGKNGITKLHGQIIDSLRYRVPVLAMYHPSPLNFRDMVRRKEFYENLKKLREYL